MCVCVLYVHIYTCKYIYKNIQVLHIHFEKKWQGREWAKSQGTSQWKYNLLRCVLCITLLLGELQAGYGNVVCLF